MVRPLLVPPADDSAESRIAALETQRNIDHHFMNEVVNVLVQVREEVAQQAVVIAEHTQSGVRLRQEIFAARSELASGIIGANDAAQAAAMAQMAVTVEAKFASLDELTAQLAVGQQILGARGHMVEQVVEQQAAGQPRQEAIIGDAFMQLDAKVSRVAALAKSADGTDVAARAHNVVPFTAAMSADIFAFKKEFADLPKHVTTEIMRIITPLTEQATEERVKILAQDESLQTMENRMIAFEVALADANGKMSAATSAAPTCSLCTPAAAPLSLWSHTPPVVSGTQATSSTSAGDPLGAMRAVIGGNNICHCIHVTELQTRVDKIEALAAAAPPRSAPPGFMPDSRGTDPWSEYGGRAGPTGSIGAVIAGEAPAAADSLPLKLMGTLGSIGYKDRPIFDHKMTLQDEYKFNGVKDGFKWKKKIEQYFITCAPVLMEVFRWAERQDHRPIKAETFSYAVSIKMTEEQAANLSTQLWGFLAAVVSGSAETMFVRADREIGEMNGIDAWRRLIRHIDHGLQLRLDDLRHEMKVMHLKPMKALADVEQGVAQFENSIYEFTQAGGVAPSDKEMKDDLLRMLPEKMQLDLLWQASKVEVGFSEFRDHVVAQCARVMNIQKPHRGIHQVEQEAPAIHARLPDGMVSEDLAMFEDVTNADELIAAFQNFKSKKNGNGGNGGRGKDGKFQARRDTRPQSGDRPPRKCANCGEQHEARTCPKPSVAVEDRKCWTCGQKHMAKDCPMKGKAPIKAIEDGSIAAITNAVAAGAFNGFFCVDHEGYETVRNHKRRTYEPSGGVTGAIGVLSVEAAAETPSGVRGSPLHGGHIGIGKFKNLKRTSAHNGGKYMSPTSGRPMPTTATLGSFMSKNNFDALRHDSTRNDTTAPVAGTTTTTSLADPSSQVSGRAALAATSAKASAPATTITSPADQTTKTPTTGATTNGALGSPALRTVGALQAGLRDKIKATCVTTIDPEGEAFKKAIEEAEGILKNIEKSINSIEYVEPQQQLCAVAPQTVKVRVALDSAACDNVIDPKDLPQDAEFEPNENDKHFKGANDSHIERYGSCKTIMNGKHGKVGCNWQMAAVSRALHSVGVVAGPKDGPGKQDILFNNEKAYVVAPGIVKKIMEHCKAVAEYDREGNLYVGEMTLQSFHRQGAQE